jgi:hypothetical protein
MADGTFGSLRLGPARIPDCRGVAQPGSAPEWGSGGRAFESLRPDQHPEHERAPGGRPPGALLLSRTATGFQTAASRRTGRTPSMHSAAGPSIPRVRCAYVSAVVDSSDWPRTRDTTASAPRLRHAASRGWRGPPLHVRPMLGRDSPEAVDPGASRCPRGPRAVRAATRTRRGAGGQIGAAPSMDTHRRRGTIATSAGAALAPRDRRQRPRCRSRRHPHVTPGARCTVRVRYSTGYSHANVLGAKTAPASGRLTWTWEGSKTTRVGKRPVTVTCTKKSKSGTATAFSRRSEVAVVRPPHRRRPERPPASGRRHVTPPMSAR